MALAGLLLAPSEYVAQEAAVNLNAGQADGRQPAVEALHNAAQRLAGAVEPQLIKRLVDLLVGAAANGILDVVDARTAAEAIWLRTVPTGSLPASSESVLCTETARLLGALAGNRRLPREEARALLVDFTLSVDVGRRSATEKALTEALVSAGKADAGLVDAIVAEWGNLPGANQRAVVDAVSVLEDRSRGGRLDTLAALPATSVLARHRAQHLLGP